MMNKQQLSRLLDDDLNEQEMNKALDALLDDPAATQTWHAMHQVRTAIDHEEGPQASLSLLDKITHAIDEEPVILAVNNLPEGNGGPAKVARRRMRSTPAYIALAASVIALVTLISYSPLQQGTNKDEVAANAPSQMELERELQSMVVQHGEFSGAAALNGLVAYAKVVNGSTAAGSIQ